MKHIGCYQNKFKKFILGMFLFVFLVIIIYSSNFPFFTSNIITKNNEFKVEDKNLKISAPLWGWINFTNTETHINTSYLHGEPAIIEGRLFHYYTNISYQGYSVSLVDNGNLYASYNDVTDAEGRFQIIYIIPFSGNIYLNHYITAEVTNPGGAVEILNQTFLKYRANSSFDVTYPINPALIGEYMNIDGYLRYDNGSAIPNALINYFWYDGAVPVDTNVISTDITGLIPPIPIPDIGTADLVLNLTFQLSPEIGYSETLVTDTNLFSNITCIWDLPSTIRALTNFIIAGQVVSKTDPTVPINNRMINIYYNGTPVEIGVQTDSNGEFSVSCSLNNNSGVGLIAIRLQNSLAKNLVTRHVVTVQPASTISGPGLQVPPFLLFFSIFLPVLGVIVGGLAFYGYRYYKKLDKLSKVVNLPLEDKITNLKILKETGRLEESLSYLFNAIFMDLINAKFGRTRNINETIRDFAIISVKELSLTPARIYPFIQKVEEIIYAKPFQITDKEFYNTIDLFSPIYFELTGYNFVLKF